MAIGDTRRDGSAGASGDTIELRHFFLTSGAAPDSQSSALDAAPVLPAQPCVLAGPPGCGKTTLLFTYAVNAAARGLRVTFLTLREAVETSPPLLSPASAPAGALHAVDMKYLRGEDDLVRWCASSHLLATPPHCVLVDGLTALLDRDVREGARTHGGNMAREVRLARCLALLVDATQHATARLARAAEAGSSTVKTCQLLIGDRSGDGGEAPPMWFVWRRWTPLALICRTARAHADSTGGQQEPGFHGSGTAYQLALLPSETGPACPGSVRYSRTANTIVADAVMP
jgi:hypothetical protein